MYGMFHESVLLRAGETPGVPKSRLSRLAGASGASVESGWNCKSAVTSI